MPSASRAASLDAVTCDAMGTLVELDDPVDRLRQALAERGEPWTPDEVAAAFRAEVAYYLPRTLEGSDDDALADLRVRCTTVFLEHLGSGLDAEGFTPAFIGSISFRPLGGVVAALARLRSAGLALACVSDWDVSLAEHLEAVGLAAFFSAVVSSAEAGAAKPDPTVFRAALARLGVSAARALHIGDGDGDRAGAGAAGLSFEPAPLGTLPERLGLGRRP
jgi:putative hydrolase of the HAD superfamily